MRILQLSTLVAFLLMGLSSNAQKTTKEPVVQITGVCLVSDSLFPAPYVSVIRGKDRRGTYSNRDGYFTIPAVSGDTLVFICTGLETTFFVVPETEEHQLQVVTKMEIAPKELSPLYILPYPAPHELKQEVLALDLPGDGHQKFKRDDVSLAQYDGMVDFSDAAYREAEKILQARYNNGFVSGGNLLSTEAWHQFMTGFKKKK
ncbi:MAG: hypothetical protein RL609_238 [Bacteroidota bacterium]|jgi:hypothetical protein